MIPHRRRISQKAKVVAADWGMELNAAQFIQLQDDLKKRINRKKLLGEMDDSEKSSGLHHTKPFIHFSKSSIPLSIFLFYLSFSSNHPGAKSLLSEWFPSYLNTIFLDTYFYFSISLHKRMQTLPKCRATKYCPNMQKRHTVPPNFFLQSFIPTGQFQTNRKLKLIVQYIQRTKKFRSAQI